MSCNAELSADNHACKEKIICEIIVQILVWFTRICDLTSRSVRLTSEVTIGYPYVHINGSSRRIKPSSAVFFSAIVHPWLGFSLPPRCTQLVWGH